MFVDKKEQIKESEYTDKSDIFNIENELGTLNTI